MEIKPSHYQPEIDRYLLLNDGTWYQLLNGHWFAPAGIPNGLVTGASRIGYLRGELGTATEFVDAPLTDGDRIQFALSKINAIPFIDGSGYVIFS